MRLLARPRSASHMILLWAGAVLIVLVSLVAAVTMGSAQLSLRDVARVIAAHAGIGTAEPSFIQDAIVWELRLPRALLAAIVGAGLATCGAVMQSLTRNPLADPYLLGVSSGASTGAVAVLILGVGAGVSVSVGAFVGALVAFVFVLILGGRLRSTLERTVLAGVAANQLFSALTTFVVLWSGSAQETRGILYWLLGSLASARWLDVAVASAVLVTVMVVCLANADALDAFAFGADAAAALGVSVQSFRYAMLIATALLTAALVAASGAIGFVGLMLPHAARLLVGPSHRRLLWASLLMGAWFLVWIDTLSRVIFAPRELPVGVATALIGVPVFALLLRRRVSPA